MGQNLKSSPSWIWAVVGVTTGLGLVLAMVVVMLVRRFRQRRDTQLGGQRVRHRSTVTDSGQGGQAWAQRTPHRGERIRVEKESGMQRIGMKKKKTSKESGKRRREPLGEDAIRLRPLKKELDIGSDTDITQSSMEDINVKSLSTGQILP
ncbi:hypothetical protein GJAV_G00009160 [Gymnothorax javanicus]|nr:hypothetical protein GJAV_G00009160 [Gymnothorax javanicus]